MVEDTATFKILASLLENEGEGQSNSLDNLTKQQLEERHSNLAK